MRSSMQPSGSARMLQRVTPHSTTTKRTFGPEYFIRLSNTGNATTNDGETELEELYHNPGVLDDGFSMVTAGEEKPTRRIPLPFLDEVSVPPVWMSGPRKERDEFWKRLKDEIFSLVDDRYLVDRCLFEPHELVDSSFKSSFLAHKIRLLNGVTSRTFITQLGTNQGDSCTLSSLQHRLRLLITHPLQRGRLNLLKMDCAFERNSAVQQQLEAINKKDRKPKQVDDSSNRTSRSRKRTGRSPGRPSSPSRKSPSPSGRTKSPSSSSRSPSRQKKPTSKLASKLRGALATSNNTTERDGAGHSRSRSVSPVTHPLVRPSTLGRSEEEEMDATTVALMEKEATERLMRLFEQSSSSNNTNAVAPESMLTLPSAPGRMARRTSSTSSASMPLHLQTNWLERCLNLILVKAGYHALLNEHAHEVSRRSKVLSREEREELEAREREERERSDVPGAVFLPSLLHPLSSRANSFLVAQGVLRDVLKVSQRLVKMVEGGQYIEGLHPHTGQKMLTVIIYEDESTVGSHGLSSSSSPASSTDPSSTHISSVTFLSRVFTWCSSPILKSFLAYTQQPYVWSLEKTAAERVKTLAGFKHEQDLVRQQLEQEKQHKLNTLREMQHVHQLRVVKELEEQMEEDIAKIRQTHLSNVAIETCKIACEFEKMQEELLEYYKQEKLELELLQQRVSERKTEQLRMELQRYTAKREDIFGTSDVNRELLLPRLTSMAWKLESESLFNDSMEIMTINLSEYIHRDPMFLSKDFPQGSLRFLISQTNLDQLAILARQEGVNIDGLLRVVEKVKEKDRLDINSAPTAASIARISQETLTEEQLLSIHVQQLQAVFNDHISQSSSNGVVAKVDDAVTEALTKLSMKVIFGQHLTEADLTAFQADLQQLLEFRSNTGTLNSEDVRQTRCVLKLLNELRIRTCLMEEVQERLTTVHEALAQSIALSEKQGDDDEKEEKTATATNPKDYDAKRKAQSTILSTALQHTTEPFKGKSSMNAFDVLKAMMTSEQKAAAAAKETATVQFMTPYTPSAARSQFALTRFKALVQRIIRSSKRRGVWLEEEQLGEGDAPNAVPACLRISQHSRRITVQQPFRYGTLHSDLSFTRLDDHLHEVDRMKQRFFFEVTIGPMDQGRALCMIGFDIDPPDNNEPNASSRINQDLPYTLSLRSSSAMQREHEESLRTFERTQYERFAHALPMLAAATRSKASPESAGSAPTPHEALAATIASLLHAANTKAATAQQAVQTRLIAAQAELPRALDKTRVTAALSAAGLQAAQHLLDFIPPAHVATEPQQETTPAQLTAALLTQQSADYEEDPLKVPFQMFPTTAYQLSQLSAPPPARLNQRASGVFWQSDGLMYAHGQSWQVGIGFTEGDVIGCGIDLATHSIYFSKNGVLFIASPNQSQADRPYELSGNEDYQIRMDEDQRGPIIGHQKFMKKHEMKVMQKKESHPSTPNDLASNQSSDQLNSPPSIALPLPLKKKGGKNKVTAEQQKAALDAAILASAASGTQVSLLDTSPISSKMTTPRASPTGADPLTILKSPLHPSDITDPMEKVEKGNAELRKRLTITTGAIPLESPVASSSPSTPNTPDRPTPISSKARGGSLLPLTSPSGGPPKRRERGLGLFGASGVGGLQQAQQLQLEQQLANVAVMQTVAAEALANAQQVYYANQTKANLLNAAIRAQTQPNAPVFKDLFEAHAELNREVRQRADQAPYGDLTAAAGLPQLPRTNRARQLKRRARLNEVEGEREEDKDGIIDYTDDDEDEEDDSDDSDEEKDFNQLSAGWTEYSAFSGLHSNTILGRETAPLPSAVRSSSFATLPIYFARKFGVSILLAPPPLQLPTLLSTQQLADVLAVGVSTLATSENISHGLQAAFRASEQLALLNQELVRTALLNRGQPVSEEQLNSIVFKHARLHSNNTSHSTSDGPPPSSSLGFHHMAKIATMARDRSAISTSEPFTLTAGQGRGGYELLASQDQHAFTSNVLIVGRTSYTLRPCVCLYSSKPMARPHRTQSIEPSAFASQHHALHSSAHDLDPSLASGENAAGPRAYIQCNFQGPFQYPLQQFRPVKSSR